MSTVSVEVIATKKNLEIIQDFVEAGKGVVKELFLTGSNAWGAYYALTLESDIDLVAIVDDVKEIGKVIEVYIAQGMIGNFEKIKYETFLSLYEKGQVDEYSCVTTYKETKVSIDFIPRIIAEKICSLGSLQESYIEDSKGIITVRTIREFCSKVPKIAGYTLDDMNAKRSTRFVCPYKEIRNDADISYIWESLVDGQGGSGNETTYLIGVKSFYFAINPITLLDENNHVKQLTDTIRSNISKVLLNKEPLYITRQEKMSEEMLKHIKESFR